jgi:HEAT repeat protein
MSHIFISYNQADADFAAVVMMHLEKGGFDTWIDKQRLRPGADWSDEIDRGIANALAVVLVMSPDSRSSEYVTYEWSFALGAGVRVVPLLLRETQIHPRLQRLQYLNFSGSIRPWPDLLDELHKIKSNEVTRWIPPRDTPPYLLRAITDIDSGNAADRHGAIGVLAESDHPIARQALRQVISHPFRDIRVTAIVHLGELNDDAVKTDEGLHALKDALGYHSPDGDNDIKWRARRIVERLGPVMFDVLAAASTSDRDPTRYSAVGLLAKTGGSKAVPLLMQMLDDSDNWIVGEAISQLGTLKATPAVDRLVSFIVSNTATNERNNINLRQIAAVALINPRLFTTAPALPRRSILKSIARLRRG